MSESDPKSPKSHMPPPDQGGPKVSNLTSDKRHELKDQKFMNQRSRIDTVQRKERVRQDTPKPKSNK